jgi:hypothetical protein
MSFEDLKPASNNKDIFNAEYIQKFFIYLNPGQLITLLQLKLLGILMINLFLT